MSDDEDELEDFDVNDEDIRRAMNPGLHRHKNRMSKEESMLGVFAHGSDSDENNDHFDKNYLNKMNAKKPSHINFISKSKTPLVETQKDTYLSTEDEEEEERLPEAEQEPEIKAKLPKVEELKMPTFATKKPAINKPTAPKLNVKEAKDIGNWEKFEKGFGSKMLEKMGWKKGLGLGKDMQGRAVPVEATLRKGKGSVGRYGPETKEVKQSNETAEEVDEPTRVHVSQWKKGHNNKKLEYSTIRTPEELLAMAANNPKKLKKAEQMLERDEAKPFPIASMSKIKIIDMTGKDQTVHRGYEAISYLTKTKSTTEEARTCFDLPELRANLDILVNMTEEKIIQSEKKMKHFEDMVVSLNYEDECHRERIAAQQTQIDSIENILAVIEKCEKQLATKSIDLDDSIDVFVHLKREYPDEFIIFNLSQVAIPLFTPILKQKMSLWRPFNTEDESQSETDDIRYCHEAYADLQELFKDSYQQSVNPYHRLVWDTWMLAFRKLLAQESIKTSGSRCVDILGAWSSLIPRYIMENILEQFVLTKLNYEVEAWNPLVDIIPIHQWIHPWLPLMKDRMDSLLFPTIRFKLSHALDSWHASDVSAKAILLPWRPPAFSQSSWDSFMCKNIVPKLELILSDELIIDPRNQNIEPWKWVMAWQELIPINSLITILERSFFPKWLQVLSAWLNASPNFEEISKWYVGWKSLFHEKLLANPNIKSKLSQGLIMMNRSVSGGPNLDNISYQMQPTSSQRVSGNNGVKVHSASNTVITSFKDIIEKKAAEHNLMFLPVPNRFSKEGQQVYRFGNLNVYIEKNVAFMLMNGAWVPTSVTELVQKAL